MSEYESPKAGRCLMRCNKVAMPCCSPTLQKESGVAQKQAAVKGLPCFRGIKGLYSTVNFLYRTSPVGEIMVNTYRPDSTSCKDKEKSPLSVSMVSCLLRKPLAL